MPTAPRTTAEHHYQQAELTLAALGSLAATPLIIRVINPWYRRSTHGGLSISQQRIDPLPAEHSRPDGCSADCSAAISTPQDRPTATATLPSPIVAIVSQHHSHMGQRMRSTSWVPDALMSAIHPYHRVSLWVRE
jgi:hypothetical protein